MVGGFSTAPWFSRRGLYVLGNRGRCGAKPKADCPVCGAARTRAAGRAVRHQDRRTYDRGPCATTPAAGAGRERGSN